MPWTTQVDFWWIPLAALVCLILGAAVTLLRLGTSFDAARGASGSAGTILKPGDKIKVLGVLEEHEASCVLAMTPRYPPLRLVSLDGLLVPAGGLEAGKEYVYEAIMDRGIETGEYTLTPRNTYDLRHGRSKQSRLATA